MNFNQHAYLMSLNHGFTYPSPLNWLQYHHFSLAQNPIFRQHNLRLDDHHVDPYVENKVKLEQTQVSYQHESFQPDAKSQIIKIEQIQSNKALDCYVNNGQSQKQDRNLNSIVIRNFVNFINAHPQSLKIISQIIEHYGLQITNKRYKNLFLNYFPLSKSYVGIGKLKKFLKHQTDVRLITLILLRKFINIDYSLVMINSKKVAKSAKLKQILHGKKLWNTLLHKIK